jgi:hypothetical protein
MLLRGKKKGDRIGKLQNTSNDKVSSDASFSESRILWKRCGAWRRCLLLRGRTHYSPPKFISASTRRSVDARISSLPSSGATHSTISGTVNYEPTNPTGLILLDAARADVSVNYGIFSSRG